MREPKLDEEALNLYSQVADDQFTICAQRFRDLLNKVLVSE